MLIVSLILIFSWKNCKKSPDYSKSELSKKSRSKKSKRRSIDSKLAPYSSRESKKKKPYSKYQTKTGNSFNSRAVDSCSKNCGKSNHVGTELQMNVDKARKAVC